LYAAQVIPQIDAEIAEKGHFRMETIQVPWLRAYKTSKENKELKIFQVEITKEKVLCQAMKFGEK